jgi:hypothetical protein
MRGKSGARRLLRPNQLALETRFASDGYTPSQPKGATLSSAPARFPEQTSCPLAPRQASPAVPLILKELAIQSAVQDV